MTWIDSFLLASEVASVVADCKEYHEASILAMKLAGLDKKQTKAWAHHCLQAANMASQIEFVDILIDEAYPEHKRWGKK